VADTTLAYLEALKKTHQRHRLKVKEEEKSMTYFAEDPIDPEKAFENPVFVILAASSANDLAYENYSSSGNVKGFLNDLDIARSFYETAFEKIDLQPTADSEINEMACRVTLADCHYHLWKMGDSGPKVEEYGVQSNSNAFRSLTEYEHAVFLDFLSGEEIFRRPEIQAQTLKRLSELWLKNSIYLSTAHGNREAIHYLLIKARILASLNCSLPNLCLIVGHLYLQQRDKTKSEDDLENGKKWLMRAIHSNDYGDAMFIENKEQAREYYDGLP
jgi:TPR repeat protein